MYIYLYFDLHISLYFARLLLSIVLKTLLDLNMALVIARQTIRFDSYALKVLRHYI
jgi:hypothetical protein